MLYFLSSNRQLLHYVSSGKLVNNDGFIHTRRNLDTFVILVGVQGTLYITQDDNQYELTPGKFLLLFPGHVHFGYRESEGNLVYFWCHFQVENDAYKLLNQAETSQYLYLMKNSLKASDFTDVYLIPEFGALSMSDQVKLIFHQILDVSNRKFYSTTIRDITLSMLAMELSQNFVESSAINLEELSERYRKIIEIIEWIKINGKSNLTIQAVADYFKYNPDYLSTTFREFTNQPLLRFINLVKIAESKRLLLDSNLTIKEIASNIGIDNDKHFMKMFKKYEDVTPTQYRLAFYKKHINRK